MAFPTDPPPFDTEELIDEIGPVPDDAAPSEGEQLADIQAVTRDLAGDETDEGRHAHPAPQSSGPDPNDHIAVGIQVLQDLLRIEARPARVRRTLRIWESKVSTAVRSRDLHAAEAWMRGVSGSAIPPEHAEAVGAAVAALSRPALIDDLLVWLVDTDAIEDAAGLFAEWGDPVVGRMIDLMALDDPPVNRRYMVDVLSLIGRNDSRLLTALVGDHRWFIVRNVAIALGRSGRLATIPVLRSLVAHEDARVRVEAIRGLQAVDADATLGEVVDAFADPDGRVRQAAISLMRACPSPDVAGRLLGVVLGGKLSAGEAERLVEVIGERRDEPARAALEEIASTRGRRGAAKQVREAAKQQLARRGS